MEWGMPVDLPLVFYRDLLLYTVYVTKLTHSH